MTIPSRLSQTQFNIIAPFIGAVLDAHPRAIEIGVLDDLSIETIARKFREGIMAKQRYGWLSKYVEEGLFNNLASKLRTSASVIPGKLYAGTRETLANLKIAGSVLTIEKAVQPTIRVPVSVLDKLALIWSFLDPRPTNFVVEVLSPSTEQLIREVEAHHDIGFEPNPTGLWSII